MTPFTLYARLELTTDQATSFMRKGLVGPSKKMDVQLYHDRKCTRPASRYPWHYTKSKPTRRNKYVMHNCCRYKLVWL